MENKVFNYFKCNPWGTRWFLLIVIFPSLSIFVRPAMDSAGKRFPSGEQNPFVKALGFFVWLIFIERQNQPLNGLAILYMLGQDFFHILSSSWRIPYTIRVNNHSWTLGTGIQTTGFIYSNLAFQVRFVNTAFNIAQKAKRTS